MERWNNRRCAYASMQLKEKLDKIPDDYLICFHEDVKVDGCLRSDEIIVDHSNKKVLLGSVYWFKENVEKYGESTQMKVGE